MNKPTVHSRPFLRQRPLSAALLAALVALPAQAAPPPGELPTGGTVVIDSGAAAITSPGAGMLQIDQSSSGVIIDWTSFSIGEEASVTFVQPSATSVALNRVIGPGPIAITAPSQIFGALNSNGRIFLVNSSGVVFGGTAEVNVGGLVASTLPISNADFLAGVGSGSFRFGDSEEAIPNAVLQVDAAGRLVATGGGTIALLGRAVTHFGDISATGGSAVLASAREVTLDFFGDGLTQVSLSLLGGDSAVEVGAGGVVEADGGRVVLATRTSDGTTFTARGEGIGIINQGVVRARSLTSRAGEIVLDAGQGDIQLGRGVVDATGGSGLSGGTVNVRGGFISYGAAEPGQAGVIDASGDAGGGEIFMAATSRFGLRPSGGSGPGADGGDGPLRIAADGRVNGAGGQVQITAGTLLRGPLEISSTGAGQAGGGVLISGQGDFDLRGVRVAAGGTTPGLWRIQTPQNFFIAAGAGDPIDPGELPPGFGAVWDSDLSASLDAGTSVEVVAGGQLNLLPAVGILRSSGSQQLALSLQSLGGFLFGGIGFSGDVGAWGIRSASGPLDVSMEALSTVGLYQGTVHSDGGDIAIRSIASSDTGVDLFQSDIDSRIAQSDAGPGGQISVIGSGEAVGIAITDSQLQSATGDILLYGTAMDASDGGARGVEILSASGSVVPRSALRTTSGDIDVVGIAASDFDAVGVLIASADVATATGDIRLTGRASGGFESTGLDLLEGQLGPTTVVAGGRILLAGQSLGPGSGVVVGSGVGVVGGGGVTISAGASDDDALVVDGLVTSAAAVNLRAGSVDAEGQVIDDLDAAMVLGGAAAGYASIASLDNITAPQLTVGHALHGGEIRLAQAHGRAGDLTFQTAGGIAIDAALALGSGRLGLLAGGDISQDAAIEANSLLVRSTAGSAILENTGNRINGNTIAADVAGDFRFVNADTVTIGSVTDPNGGAISGITAGGDIFVRSLGGDLVQQAAVSGGGFVDLVSAGVYLNSGAALAAGARWKVWADTWVGESRGGVAGSGPLPNLYSCAFQGFCAVSVSATANQFVYAQQPTATISIDSFLREYGLANPDLSFSIDGLILGDSFGSAVAGAPSTAADVSSNVGSYAINGGFTSAAGYALVVAPGTLQVTPATLLLLAAPSTRVYGDPDEPLDGTVSGFRNSDTLASATSGMLSWSTSATTASNVGSYAINGSGLSAQNYVFVQAASNQTALTITPATLFLTADVFTRPFGAFNPPLSGTVDGFRNGDTLSGATTGELVWTTQAGRDALPGAYAVEGGGLAAQNYVFEQAPTNATALTVQPTGTAVPVDLIRENPTTYLYDRNIGPTLMCPVSALADPLRADPGTDTLAREWSRVRSRPNLTSCVASERRNGCGDF